MIAGGVQLLTAFGGMGAGAAGSGLATIGGSTAAGALGYGAVGAAAYATVSTNLFQNGGFTSAQEGYLGSITSGVAAPPSNGTHEQRIAQGLNNRMIKPSVQSGQNLSGVSQLFGTECPLNLSVAQCQAQGKNPGTGWRTDSYMQAREVLMLREQYQRCYDGGYRGELLAKCAAPGRPDLLQAIGQ